MRVTIDAFGHACYKTTGDKLSDADDKALTNGDRRLVIPIDGPVLRHHTPTRVKKAWNRFATAPKNQDGLAKLLAIELELDKQIANAETINIDAEVFPSLPKSSKPTTPNLSPSSPTWTGPTTKRTVRRAIRASRSAPSRRRLPSSRSTTP